MPKKEASNVTRIKAGSNSSKSASNKKAPAAKKPAASKEIATRTSAKTVASAETKSKKSTAAKKVDSKKSDKPTEKKRRNPFAAIGGYFKGAWYELRQVRWPDRKATWSMTGALLLFTAFFIVLILLLDLGFQYLFKLLIG